MSSWVNLYRKTLTKSACLSFTKAMASNGSNSSSEFNSIKYSVQEGVAHIELNRPNVMNAIDFQMPMELENATELANLDDNVKVRFSFLRAPWGGLVTKSITAKI